MPLGCYFAKSAFIALSKQLKASFLSSRGPAFVSIILCAYRETSSDPKRLQRVCHKAYAFDAASDGSTAALWSASKSPRYAFLFSSYCRSVLLAARALQSL